MGLPHTGFRERSDGGMTKKPKSWGKWFDTEVGIQPSSLVHTLGLQTVSSGLLALPFICWVTLGSYLIQSFIYI